MTSNLGSEALANVTATEADGEDPEYINEAVRKRKTELATKLVHSHFSPEFVNRLDDVIVFNPLSKPAMLRICNLQLQKVIMCLHLLHIIYWNVAGIVCCRDFCFHQWPIFINRLFYHKFQNKLFYFR